MSSINLTIRFKGEKRLNAFSRSTDITQVSNEMPTDKRHIKVPQDRMQCHTHVNKKKKTGLPFFILSVLHDQTSVESVK